MAHVLGPTLLCRGLESCGFYKDAEGEYTRIQATHRDFLSDPSLSSTLHFYTSFPNPLFFSGGVDRASMRVASSVSLLILTPFQAYSSDAGCYIQKGTMRCGLSHGQQK